MVRLGSGWGSAAEEGMCMSTIHVLLFKQHFSYLDPFKIPVSKGLAHILIGTDHYYNTVYFCL